MSFNNIKGQREVITSLENSIRSNKVGHGYIFSGPRGIGKRTVAKVFASLLLCQELSKNGHELSPCGSCLCCQLVQNGTNPDLHIVETDENSISVEEIRKLQSDINIRPMYSKRKVYLIFDCDKMTVQAQNCLLKTLEEPPGYGVIILTSSNYDALLETIRSRSLRYNFRKNTSQEIREILEDRCVDSIKEKDFIISYSDGIIGTALELAQSGEFAQIREQTLEIVQKLVKARLLDVFEVYDFFEDNKANIDTILDIMTLYYRDLLVALNSWKENILINSDKKDIILDNVSKYTINKLVRNVEIIENTRRSLKYNANYQLAVETMLMKLQEDCI